MCYFVIWFDNGVFIVAGIKEEVFQFDGYEYYLELGLFVFDKYQGFVSFLVWIKVDELCCFDWFLGKFMDGINKFVWQFGFGLLGDLQWGFFIYINGWKDYWINYVLLEDEWVYLVVVVDQSLG